MSLQYPIIIDNEPELLRFVRDLINEATKDPYANLPLLMSKQDVYKLVGRDLADRAIKNGSLKLSFIDGRYCIKKQDFINWINNENPKRR